MAIRSTGIRPIERNGLKGFGLTISIDNTASRSSSSRCAIPERLTFLSARGTLPAGATAEAGDAIVSRSPESVTGNPFSASSQGRYASAGASVAAASPFYSAPKQEA